MKNTVTVQITFSFQGVKYSPSSVIDFDEYYSKNRKIPEIFHLVAMTNNIDAYSYQYEVMEMGHYKYFDAKGLAQQFCHDDYFDFSGCEMKWKEHKVLEQLTEIAIKYLDIDNLDEDEKLKSALLKAYYLGSRGEN